MAKRKGRPKAVRRGSPAKTAGARKSVSRPKARKPARKARSRKSAGAAVAKTKGRGARKTATRRAAAPQRSTTKPFGPPPGPGQATRTKASRLDRERRRLEETVPTPPSSLDMNRRGTSARTGRRELAESLEEHKGMTPALTGGDVDADWEEAYFTGDEAPGGDNPTPDQDVVEDIGRSLGVEYQDNEELKSTDKVAERDKHRWELDPASSEDYKDRE